MFKTVLIMKRREGMSFEDFVDYYENKHSKFVRTIPTATRYFRKYLRPLGDSHGRTADRESEFDVIMEVWWPDKETREETLRNRDAQLTRMITEDELNLFDRSKILLFTYEEYETPLPLRE